MPDSNSQSKKIDEIRKGEGKYQVEAQTEKIQPELLDSIWEVLCLHSTQ